MGTAQIGTGNISYTHGLYSKFFLTTQLAFRMMNGVLLPGLGCVAQRGLWLYYTGAALQFGAFFWNCGGGSIVGSRRNRQEAWREYKLGPSLVERAATRCMVGRYFRIRGWAGWKGSRALNCIWLKVTMHRCICIFLVVCGPLELTQTLLAGTGWSLHWCSC